MEFYNFRKPPPSKKKKNIKTDTLSTKSEFINQYFFKY